MSGTVTAEIRFINPEWKHRKVPPVIGDRASRRTHTTKHRCPSKTRAARKWTSTRPGSR